MIAVLLACFFLAVVLAYFGTEYLLARLDAGHQVFAGHQSPLGVLLGANIVSFTVMWVSSLIFVVASGSGLYLAATVICICAQAVWLTQHLWSYYRNRLRVT